MKKYIELNEGQILQKGDEWKVQSNPDKWEELPAHLWGKTSWAIFTDIRRPIPYEGKVAFLVNYSPIIRVVVDTTGLSDEEIDEKIAEQAKNEFAYSWQEKYNYFEENIDWKNTVEDTEVPYEEEPKNTGEYRLLEEGEEIKDGDEVRFFMEKEWSPVTKSVGGKVLGAAVGSFRRKI